MLYSFFSRTIDLINCNAKFVLVQLIDTSAITFTKRFWWVIKHEYSKETRILEVYKGYLFIWSKYTYFTKSNFVFVLTYFIVCSCFAKNKPQTDVSNSAMYTSDKPRQQMDQTFNINNWGFGSADRKILLQMKSKIDSLQEKSTPTGNSFTFIVFENYRLDIKRVADITRLNVIMLTKYVLVSVCLQDGWVCYGNFGYLIINIRTLKWSDARRTWCQMLGGDLAIIKSAAGE